MRNPEIHLALSYAAYYGTTFEDFLEIARTMHFAAVQLTPDQVPNLYSDFPPERLEALRTQALDSGIELHFHNVFYDINPVSLVPEVRNLALRISEEVFDLANALSAKTVTAHAGYMFGGWRRDEIQRSRFWGEAASGLHELGEMARSRGIRLLFENGSYYVTTATGFRPRPLHLGIEPAELRRIVEMAGPGTGVVLDINKAIHSGVRPIRFVEEFGSLLEQFQVSSAEDHRPELHAIVEGMRGKRTEITFVLEGSRKEGENAKRIISEIA